MSERKTEKTKMKTKIEIKNLKIHLKRLLFEFA